MGWISLIFNVLWLVACSTKPSIKAPGRAPAPVPQKSAPSGPTKPTDKFFVDVTEHLGLKQVVATRLYAVDFDSDGHTDLVVLPRHYAIPQFYRFDPAKKRFAKLSPSPVPFHFSFLGFADLNKDGILDMVAGTFNQKTALLPQPLRVFKGGPSVTYKEVSKAFPKKSEPTASIALFDYNLDGHLDIYAGNWYNLRKKDSRPAPDRLFAGKMFTFTDKTTLLEGELKYDYSLEAHTNARPTFGVSVCDIDQNGYPDILTANSAGHGNRLWISRKGKAAGERLFRDFGKASNFSADAVGAHSPQGGGNSSYVKCADYNNDGAMDVAVGEVTRSYDGEERDLSSVLTGTSRHFPPRFLRSVYLSREGVGIWNQGDRRGVWFDHNGDGLLDFLVDNSGFPPKSRLILFEQAADHAFEDRAEVLGINILNPAGTVTLDFNRDGKMDFITGQTSLRKADIPRRLYAFANTTKPKGRNLRFTLRGRRANIQGLGGMIILKTNKRSYRQMVDFLYGPQPAQNEEGVTFFLPPGEQLTFVEVRWPIHKRDKVGRLSPLVRTYRLGKKAKGEITLCENGKWFSGRGPLSDKRCR